MPFFPFLALLAAIAPVTGCQESTTDPVIHTIQDGLTGQEILNRTRMVYREADAYSDKALLSLSYRLHGQAFREQQPWRTSFSRAENRLAGDWFNSKIRNNGKSLRCFIYDIDTENMDNQLLQLEAVDRIALDELLRDPIARRFTGGDSELPLRSTRSGAIPQMVPPVADLLFGQLRWPILDEPELIVRAEDALVDQRPCFHVQLHRDGMMCDFWIDQESFLLRQMTLPVELIDPAILESSEVDQIQFFARMHDCQFSVADEQPQWYELAIPRGAFPVRNFVKLPSEFPCGSIGKSIAPLEFRSLDGKSKIIPAKSRISILVWLPDLIDNALIESIRGISSEAPNADLYCILNDSHFPSGAADGVLHADVAGRITEIPDKVRLVVDSGMENWEKTGLLSHFASLVMDVDGIVQYAISIPSNDWNQKIVASANRSARGEDVAAEMIADYEKHINNYREQLEMVSLETVNNPDSLESTPSLPAIAELAWTVGDLRAPGNISIAASRILVAEGWRSVAEIDLSGKLMTTHILEIPDGAAISRLRAVASGEGVICAACSILGDGVFVFGTNWQLLGIIDRPGEKTERVTDCDFSVSSDGSRLVVAFEKSGIQEYGAELDRGVKLSDVRADQVMVNRTDWCALSNGKLIVAGENGDGMVPFDLDGQQALFAKLSQRPGAGKGTLTAAGVSGGKRWRIVQRDLDGTNILQQEIGPLLFDIQIEPLVVEPATGWIVVADSNGMVRVFDDQLVGKCQLSIPGIRGINAIKNDGQLLIVTATAEFVQGWTLPIE